MCVAEWWGLEGARGARPAKQKTEGLAGGKGGGGEKKTSDEALAVLLFVRKVSCFPPFSFSQKKIRLIPEFQCSENKAREGSCSKARRRVPILENTF